MTYRFSAMQQDGTTPVTYDPCRPIHYVTRPDGGPAEGDALVAAAVAQVSAATGLRFTNDGHTTESPVGERPSFQPDRYGDRWAPALIVWETANEQPDFGVDVARWTSGWATRCNPDGGSAGCADQQAARFNPALQVVQPSPARVRRAQ